MKRKTLVLASIVIAGLPQSVGWYQFLHNGGMQWPMEWLNEETAWGLLLAPLAIWAALYQLRYLKTNKTFSIIAILLSLSVVYPTLYNYWVWGFDLSSSSKSDDNSLNMAEFWVSRWWE